MPSPYYPTQPTKPVTPPPKPIPTQPNQFLYGQALPPTGPYGNLTPEQLDSPYAYPQPDNVYHYPYSTFNYRAPLNLLNEVQQQATDMMGPSGGVSAYSNSPYTGRLDSTLAALQSMGKEAGVAGRSGGGGTDQELIQGDISGIGARAKTGLTLQEVDRLNQLMNIEKGVYSERGKAVGQAYSEEATQRNIKTSQNQAESQQLSQIPIVGPLVAGLS